MKYISIAIVVLTISGTLFSANNSNDVVDENGSDWQSGSPDFKFGYVLGYISAMSKSQMGVDILCIGLKFPSVGPEASPEAQKNCMATSERLKYGDITVGQFQNGLDAFYKDFRNTQYPLHAAIGIVRDQVNGRAAEDIEKELVQWRQCRADIKKCAEMYTPKH